MTKIEKMMVIMASVVAMMTGAAIARADVKPPNYRCEKAKARAEAQEFGCLDRCQRRAASMGAETEGFFDDCATACHEKCERKKDRIENSGICIDTPNPDRCGAKHLQALAQLKFCLSNCPETEEETTVATDPVTPGKEPRSVICRQACEAHYVTARDRIDATEACMAGGAPICTYQ